MHKIFVALVFSLFFGVSSLVYAGFTGQSVTPSKVRNVKKMRDDTNVVLVGKIEKSLGGEKYQFTDETGSIIVEIDEEKWMGLEIGPTDTVEIYGEVDKDWERIKIDVDRIIKK